MKIYTALLLSLCATVCSAKSIYPNVTLEGTTTPEVTRLNQMFIYNWSPVVQATCVGAVTKLEYCYQRIAVQTIPIFTLVFLKPDPRGFRVTHTINVAAGDLSSCTMRGGVNTCCETKILGRLEQFGVPSVSTAFGVYAVGKNRILGYSVGQEDSVTGYQLAIDLMDDGLVRVAANNTATVEYRMLNLISEPVAITNITDTGGTSTSTVTPFTLSTDETTRTPAEENETADMLSTMAKVEIVLGSLIAALFVASLGLWIYLCHKARKMQRASSSNVQICEIEHPIYEHVSSPKQLQSSTESDKELPPLFHRNPAYAVQTTQPEQDSNASTRRPKLHHDWIL